MKKESDIKNESVAGKGTEARQDTAKKKDRRVRKTRACLRDGLAKLLQKKSIGEITVKELVDAVDINRSTFYLHYTDIYNMLESIEEELLGEITDAIRTHPIGVDESTFPFIEDIFCILTKNREICAALLGPNGDGTFLYQIEHIIEENSMKALRLYFADSIEDLKYTYSFCLAGCLGVIKTWLGGPSAESPTHMAKLTYQLVANSLNIKV